MLATLSVSVAQKASPTSIILTPADTGVEIGKTLQLTASPYPASACNHFTFKSSNSRVASVDARGLVTAKKTGKVTITVASRQNTRVRVTRTLVVVSPDSPLYIKPEFSDLTLTTGTVTPLAAAAYPETKSQQFLYKSSSTRVLVVSPSGMITTKRAGTATITITSAVNKDVTAQVKVRVMDLPAPTKLTISPASGSVQVGGTLQLTATPSPAGTSAGVTWKSSANAVAAVSDTGLVTARQPGTVILTATSRQNRRVTATVRLVVYHPRWRSKPPRPMSSRPPSFPRRPRAACSTTAAMRASRRSPPRA